MASKKKAKKKTAKTSTSGACKRKYNGATCGAVNAADATHCYHCGGDPTKATEQ